jgi:hypothetical protein
VRLGAANRALSRLGIPWRFGAFDKTPAAVRGGRLDGVTVSQRHDLVREGGTATDTLATAGGAPWIVAGPGYVLVASRLDTAASNLPIRAVFLPWLAEQVGIRLAAPSGDLGAPINALPGAAVQLPIVADALESSTGARRAVSSERVTAPEERGVWFIMHGGRRAGAIVVDAPPEESALARWSATALAPRLAANGSQGTEDVDGWIRNIFAAASRRPVLTPLLRLALLLLAAEAVAVRTSRSVAT